MLLLIGASASGKTELAKCIVKKYGMRKVVTYTTRAPRVNEVDGIDYNFVSVENFLSLIDQDYFVETTCYNSNYYGTAKKDVSNDKIAVLDPNGLRSFKALNDRNIIAVFLECDEKTRKERMILRKDDPECIKHRLEQDKVAFAKSNVPSVDFTIDSSIKTVDELATIVMDFYNKEITNENN